MDDVRSFSWEYLICHFVNCHQKLVVTPGDVWQFPGLFNRTSTMARATIRSGGKQYRVNPGDTIAVEKLGAGAGEKVIFPEVVMYEDGGEIKVGAPFLEGAKVTGEVIEQFKDKKVVAFKYRRRKGYHRTVGHRRLLTRVKIESVEA